jgi:hypothetical protein
MINKIIKGLANYLGFIILDNKTNDALFEEISIYTDLLSSNIDHSLAFSDSPSKIGCIVFSKDRPLQLHCLLSSYFEHVSSPAPVHVLFASSNSRYKRGYEALFQFFGSRLGSITEQKNFKKDIIDIIENLQSSQLFFLVDDIVFIRKMDLSVLSCLPANTFIISLRLGKNILLSHTGLKKQMQPHFISHKKVGSENLNIWSWAQGETDWAYPLSLDGNIFATAEMISVLKYLNFHSPNTLEASLQKINRLALKRYGVCFDLSKIVNLPYNRVQTDFDNVSGSISTDYLLQKWEEGMAIDYRKMYNYTNTCPHELVPVEFVRRDAVDKY